MTGEKSTPLVELTDVSFSYGKHEVLSCVNLTILRGDYLALIGPNGGGKTTLLKVILGLVTPIKGTIRLLDASQKNTGRTLLGYVPQKTSLFDEHFPATVHEVVLMGRYAKRGLLHRMTKEDQSAVKRSLENVGLWGERDRLIGDLSGGQQQRVFIARALSSEPQILFLDEPTSGVDHKAQKEFYTLLRELHQNNKLTIVLVSHDIGMVAQEASRLAYIDTTLSYYESPQEFLHDGAQHALTHGHDH